MISWDFALKLLTLPYTIIKAVLEYYTFGTPYSRTNREFKNSLYKNVLLSIEYHVSGNYKKQNLKAVVYQPITKVIKKFKSHPLASQLNNFGKKFDKYSYWIHESDKKDSKVLIYMHGGGYMLNMFESQFVFISALHYALDDHAAENTSILVVDYSLTMFDQAYPTQLFECLTSYSNLVKAGYKDIFLLGDSAGAHMALSIARAVAYPKEVEEQFNHYPKFKLDFDVCNLPQPKGLLLISPWVEPTIKPKVPNKRGINTWGDLGAFDTSLGDAYAADNDRAFINNFLNFTNTNWEDHWKNVEPLNNGNNLMIVGEREVLRDGVDDFYDIIKKSGKVDYHTEPGGIHAGLVYVECLDYASKKGAKRALKGDFKDQYLKNIIFSIFSPFIELPKTYLILPSPIDEIIKAIVDIFPVNYDDGSLAPAIVRLAWHCCATYDAVHKTGGSNGSTMRLVPEITDEGNFGLDIARAALESVKQKFPQISYADLWTLAGKVAIEYMGGPTIIWKSGRVDCVDENYVPPNGLLPFAYKDANHIRVTFTRMGLNDQETVALLGTHCLGRCHKRFSGWEGKWTKTPTKFTNEYFKVLLNESWSQGIVPETGKVQYYNSDSSLMMLNTDMELLRDQEYYRWVQVYANDKEKFFADFGAAFSKLLELGVVRD
ncbi:hypothetical protein G210_4953 [Candida maltosa Xu316]|uniref:Peroxidase n=1 Tax=Candida maltosa (strain Xu316) TaxID=1245528 RepID=M3JCZ5_CANMX|nr:hypothetical protein G210_4953 [Candida maltosa Xu316]